MVLGLEKSRTRGHTLGRGCIMQVIESDEIYKIMIKIGEIKRHLKKHFDLDGNNQPWHLFDSVHFDLMRIAGMLDDDISDLGD